LRLSEHFFIPGEAGLAGFIKAKDGGTGADNWSYKMCKAGSNHHHQQTNTQCFTGRKPFLTPNQQCQSTAEKNIAFQGLAHSKLTWGSLSLTIKGS